MHHCQKLCTRHCSTETSPAKSQRQLCTHVSYTNPAASITLGLMSIKHADMQVMPSRPQQTSSLVAPGRLLACSSRNTTCLAPSHFASFQQLILKVTPMFCRGPALRVKYAGIANNAVKAAFQNAGFKRTSRAHWNVLWSKALKPDAYSGLTKFQRVGHFR